RALPKTAIGFSDIAPLKSRTNLELGFEEGPDDEAQETNGEQIIAILKENEAGMKTADLCRKHGIRKNKAKYGGLEVSETERLKGLIPILRLNDLRAPNRGGRWT